MKLRRVNPVHALELMKRAAIEELDEMEAEFRAEDGEEHDPTPWNNDRARITAAEDVSTIYDVLQELDFFQDGYEGWSWAVYVLTAKVRKKN